ncbi:MAG: 4Fe-4S dicluster domain-containing protein [Alphaproteobacteria bacterium]|nr:4Fe-4S dicluster domain-containing protein [Alphaproteobacteria bacterium]
MDSIIFLSMLVLGGIAVVASAVLYMVSRKFAVKEDIKILEIDAVLPQANCGGCGFAGCHDFAKACSSASEEKFANLRCPVGGQPVMDKIAAIKGVVAIQKQPSAAVLRCNGTCQNAPQKVAYDGITSCRIAARISSGQTGCPTGCLRLGDCVKNCQFGALSIDPVTQIPVVDYNKCTSCGACVRTCPRGLFEIRNKGPQGQMVYVACRNTQKGALARKNCKAACIACLKCTKINPEVKVENNLSYIPDTVPAEQFGQQLKETCPTGAINYYSGGENTNV